MSGPRKTTCNVIPGLRYRDGAAAIDFLCRAFGFEKQLVVPDEDGGIAHAQLTFGNGMIMLGSSDHGEYSKHVKPPGELDGMSSQGAYVIVDDADAHYQRAVAAGAKIVLDIVDQSYGGRGYTCKDPEGHVWSFGTYDPWATD